MSPRLTDAEIIKRVRAASLPEAGAKVTTRSLIDKLSQQGQMNKKVVKRGNAGQ